MGRPKLWFKQDSDYVEYGTWGFNQQRLKNKIRPGATDNDCTEWLGAMSPTGALMGAWKKDANTGEYRQQMTQARRLVWMSENQEDATPYRVTLTCGNQRCCNPRHFELLESNRTDKQLW